MYSNCALRKISKLTVNRVLIDFYIFDTDKNQTQHVNKAVANVQHNSVASLISLWIDSICQTSQVASCRKLITKQRRLLGY